MKNIIVTFALITLSISTFAAPLTFDFKDPKGVNNAIFNLDAPLEAISGTASGVSGTISYDPENPSKLKGKIVVDTKSLKVPNPMMQDHMLGKQWMDAEQYPEITFEAKEVDVKSRDGAKVDAHVTGTMTIRGISKELTAPVSFTYLKDKLGLRMNGRMEGDLLVVRANFTIKRADFGINPGAPADKVAEEVQLTLSLAGMAPRK
jgi:polyisoprenoid-binding protein YceI